MGSTSLFRRRFLTMSVVLVVCMLLSACAPKQSTPTPKPEPIKIAIIGAMSGTNAVLGDWMKKGVTLAVEEKNKAGGICGRQIEIVIYDDEADPTKSVNLATKVCTEDKVVAAWATTNSTSALADIPIFEQYKVTQLTNGTNVQITGKGSKFIFRSCPAGTAYEYPLVEFLVKKGHKKFALITDTSAYGKGEADYQTTKLKELGLEPLTRENYGIDDKDFTGQLTKIMQTNPEVLLLGGSEIASGLIAKQARQLGFKGQIAGGPAIGTPKFIETAGNDAAEGVFFTGAYPTNDLNDMTRAFAKRYADRWNGEQAEIHGANTYDGTQMLMMAMEKACPNITGETIAAEFHKICGYKGLQGEFCVTPEGETLTKTLLGIITGGKLTVYTGN